MSGYQYGLIKELYVGTPIDQATRGNGIEFFLLIRIKITF